MLHVTNSLLKKKNLHQHDKSWQGSKSLKESSPRKKIIQTLKISRTFTKNFPVDNNQVNYSMVANN